MGYEYLGNWEYREGNSNIEVELLTQNLRARGYDDNLINKAIDKLKKDASLGGGRDLYEANRDVYDLLRYGVKVKPGVGEQYETVWLIDWAEPGGQPLRGGRGSDGARPAHQAAGRGAVRQRHRARDVGAEAVEGRGVGGHPADDRQPEAGVHPTVLHDRAAGDGRQRCRGAALRRHRHAGEVLAGVARGLGHRGPARSGSHAAVLEGRGCSSCIHDFMVFDAGIKKTCRHNQYFGVKAAQERIAKREGGIIWHTQGSGKSLTMVWLAKWIREHQPDARVLLITDRTELDEQIERVFNGVNETIYRTRAAPTCSTR